MHFLGCAGVDLEKGIGYTTETETMMVRKKRWNSQ